MYDEDGGPFTRAMHGVMKNISYLCKRDRSKTWGEDGRKKVVVCHRQRQSPNDQLAYEENRRTTESRLLFRGT
jgi:hypothetical protein